MPLSDLQRADMFGGGSGVGMNTSMGQRSLASAQPRLFRVTSMPNGTSRTFSTLEEAQAWRMMMGDKNAIIQQLR